MTGTKDKVMSINIQRTTIDRKQKSLTKYADLCILQPVVISSQYHDPSSVSSARPSLQPGSGSGSGNAPEIKYDVEYEKGSMGTPGSLAITVTECRVRP